MTANNHTALIEALEPLLGFESKCDTELDDRRGAGRTVFVEDIMDERLREEIGSAEPGLFDVVRHFAEPIRQALADASTGGALAQESDKVEYLIWSGEHNAYWRPDGAGYSTRIRDAGRYTLEDAKKRTNHCGPEKKIEIEPIAAQPIGGEDVRTADRLERVAAQLSAERIQGWANPLVVDIMDAVRRLRNETPEPDTGEAVLSATPQSGWRPIEELTYDVADGRLILIKAPSLYHADWNPEATAQATLMSDEPGDPLCTVRWCGTHDHWVSVEVTDATEFMLFPEPPK